jgi:membrane protein
VNGVFFGVSLFVGLLLVFLVLCIIYWAVPNRYVPWRAIWPGALAATLAIGIVDYGFPLYLSTISTVGAFTTIFVFVLIVLVWFYLVAIIILGGGVLNAMRFELHDTGELSQPAAAS